MGPMDVDALVLHSERLLIRPWRADDLLALSSMNADPEVMRHFPKRLDRSESAAMMAYNIKHMARHGFGWWAMEARGAMPFVGAIGLFRPRFDAHFTPCFEIGWRLPKAHWDKGYATEAARAVLDFAFDQVLLDEVVAMTTVGNERSRNVMARLGMTCRAADDFQHPLLPPDHPLGHHVLYRMTRHDWTASGESLER
jgi:RimJ/RimL family protein N-acetyltransferase